VLFERNSAHMLTFDFESTNKLNKDKGKFTSSAKLKGNVGSLNGMSSIKK